MNVTKVTYGRIKNLGNYQNERLEVEITLNEGESYKQAFKAAEMLVCGSLGLIPNSNENEARYKRILDDKESYSYKEVMEAEAYFSNKDIDINDKNILSK